MANFAILQKCATQTHCLLKPRKIPNVRYLIIKLEGIHKTLNESAKPAEHAKRGCIEKDALALNHQNMSIS